MKETIAIGDNFNDLSMIKVAGLGVGVQNTVEEMKKECDIITKATNNQGGNFPCSQPHDLQNMGI